MLTFGPSQLTRTLSSYGVSSDAAGSLAYGSSAPTSSDQTAAIQAAINALATATGNGGALMIWDVAVGLSTRILIPSNFTIFAPTPQCGAIMRLNANAPMFRNAGIETDASTSLQNTFGKLDGAHAGDQHFRILDAAFFNNKNIRIVGGTWNWNVQNQSGARANATYGANSTMQFWGVDGLILEDMLILSGSVYAVHFANVRGVEIARCYADQSPINTNTFSSDGFHFNGPAQAIWAHDLRTHCGDDNFALNADDTNDAGLNTSLGTSGVVVCGTNYPCGGDITDVLLDGLSLTTGAENIANKHCIRLLSSAHRIDGVVMRKVYGQTVRLGIAITIFSNTLCAGSGNFGTLVFDDIAIDMTSPFGGNDGSGIFSINGNMELLKIRGRVRHNIAAVTPDIFVSNSGTIEEINLEGDYWDPAGAGNNAAPIASVAGTVHRFVAKVVSSRDSSLATIAAPVLKTATGAVIGLADITADMDRATNIVDHQGGTLTRVAMRGTHTNAGGGSPLNIATGLTVTDGWHPDLAATNAFKSGAGALTNDNTWSG